jgi:hypothetical protein
MHVHPQDCDLQWFVLTGYKMPRSFVATAFNTSSICGSMLDGFNQFTETAESNLDSFTMKGKSPKTVVIVFLYH